MCSEKILGGEEEGRTLTAGKSSASSAQAVAVQEQHSHLCKASRSTESVFVRVVPCEGGG